MAYDKKYISYIQLHTNVNMYTSKSSASTMKSRKRSPHNLVNIYRYWIIWMAEVARDLKLEIN